MTGGPSRFRRRVALWAERLGLRLDLPEGWDQPFFEREGHPLRPGAGMRRLGGWERRYGHVLPESLRLWLAISDGLFTPNGPLIHPLTAIGPMIPFASVPGLIVQPESWFELGNPGRETICIDLGYTWPGGDCAVFLSGDDDLGSKPRVIARSFGDWLARLLAEGGREFWFDPGFRTLGDPWTEHRQHVPTPHLPDRLKSLTVRVLPLMTTGADDRSIATMLGVSTNDVEALFRHLQHASRP